MLLLRLLIRAFALVILVAIAVPTGILVAAHLLDEGKVCAVIVCAMAISWFAWNSNLTIDDASSNWGEP